MCVVMCCLFIVFPITRLLSHSSKLYLLADVSFQTEDGETLQVLPLESYPICLTFAHSHWDLTKIVVRC